MEKMNIPIFYQLGTKLKPIVDFEYDFSDRMELFPILILANITIKELLEKYPALNVCRAAGEDFIQSTDDIVSWYIKSNAEDLGKPDYETDQLFTDAINKAKEFEIVLLAELQTLATYHATQKGIYSTTDLIERAENIFPPAILSKLTQDIKEEIRESGRCLAFDNATSSAFHIMRATELVLHQYYLCVCNPKHKTKNRLPNWGAYITELEKSTKPEVKEVIAIIQQIKDRHRNLIMHPDVVLTPDEAFTLFEIAQGVIIAMANELPKIK